MKMTDEEREELEARIEKLEGKVKALNADLNSIEDDMISTSELAKAIHEIQDELKKQGICITNDIYAPTMVGGN
jgi:prefoldin subunit 5